MSDTRSLVLVVPVSLVQRANDFLQNAGFGPDNLSTPARTPGSTYATHVGCHWWATPNDIFIIRQQLIGAGFSAAQVDAALSELLEGQMLPRNHWLQKLSGAGLEWPDRETWITPPVMAGAIVRKAGKDWRSDIDYNVYEPGVFKWTRV